MTRVVFVGEMYNADLSVGGGPIIPAPQPPLGIWGPTDPEAYPSDCRLSVATAAAWWRWSRGPWLLPAMGSTACRPRIQPAVGTSAAAVCRQHVAAATAWYLGRW